MLIGVLHCIPDEDYPGQIVATLMESAAPGVRPRPRPGWVGVARKA
jgi:hypothetical protein